MGVEVGEVFVPADVVPVDVGGYGGGGLVRQPPDLLVNVAKPQPGVDEQGAVRTGEEVTVRLLPVAVFADHPGAGGKLFGGEPGAHKNSFRI